MGDNELMVMRAAFPHNTGRPQFARLPVPLEGSQEAMRVYLTPGANRADDQSSHHPWQSWPNTSRYILIRLAEAAMALGTARLWMTALATAHLWGSR